MVLVTICLRKGTRKLAIQLQPSSGGGKVLLLLFFFSLEYKKELLFPTCSVPSPNPVDKKKKKTPLSWQPVCPTTATLSVSPPPSLPPKKKRNVITSPPGYRSHRINLLLRTMPNPQLRNRKDPNPDHTLPHDSGRSAQFCATHGPRMGAAR